MKIEEYIPTGYENRVSRKYLCDLTGFDDREIRAAIANSEELIISVDGGYFIPKKGEDIDYVYSYLFREKRRIDSLLKKQTGNIEKLKRWKHDTD